MLSYSHHPKTETLERFRIRFKKQLDKYLKKLDNQEIKNHFGWEILIDYVLANLSLNYCFEESSEQLIQQIQEISHYIGQGIFTYEYINHDLFIQYLSIATLAKDNDTLDTLLNLNDEQLENPAFLERDYPRICAKIIRAYHQQEIDKIHQLISSARNFPKVSPQRKRWLGTLIDLIEAIINQDTPQIKQGIMKRQETYLKIYKRGDERHSPESLLDINGLGILARGYQNYQLNTEVETVYLPKSLWRI